MFVFTRRLLSTTLCMTALGLCQTAVAQEKLTLAQNQSPISGVAIVAKQKKFFERTAVGVSFSTLVAAELAGTFSGVAYRIEIAHQNMQTAQMMGGLLVLGALSSLADRGFAWLSRRWVWWQGA